MRFAPNGGKTKIIKYSFFSLLFLDDLSMMIYLDNYIMFELEFLVTMSNINVLAIVFMGI